MLRTRVVLLEKVFDVCIVKGNMVKSSQSFIEHTRIHTFGPCQTQVHQLLNRREGTKDDLVILFWQLFQRQMSIEAT